MERSTLTDLSKDELIDLRTKISDLLKDYPDVLFNSIHIVETGMRICDREAFNPDVAEVVVEKLGAPRQLT